MVRGEPVGLVCYFLTYRGMLEKYCRCSLDTRGKLEQVINKCKVRWESGRCPPNEGDIFKNAPADLNFLKITPLCHASLESCPPDEEEKCKVALETFPSIRVKSSKQACVEPNQPLIASNTFHTVCDRLEAEFSEGLQIFRIHKLMI